MIRPSRTRAYAFLFAALGLLLLATGQAVYSRPMDGLSIAWFICVLLVSATATIVTARTLLRQFRRDNLRSSLDGVFWIVFLVLPICIGLLGTAIWTLCWYFLGWG